MIRIHNIKNAIINNLHILYDNNKLFDFCVDENIIKSYDKYLEHQRKDIEKCKLFNGNNGFGEILYNNMPIRNFDKEYR